MPCTKVEYKKLKMTILSLSYLKAPIELTEDGVKYIETKMKSKKMEKL